MTDTIAFLAVPTTGAGLRTVASINKLQVDTSVCCFVGHKGLQRLAIGQSSNCSWHDVVYVVPWFALGCQSCSPSPGSPWLARGNKLLGEGLSRLLWRYVLFLNLMPSGLYISTHTATMGSEMLRGVYPERSEWAQHDRAVTPATSPNCHPERSEGSVAIGREMLRCAQHDRAVTTTNARIKVFMCIITPLQLTNAFPPVLESSAGWVCGRLMPGQSAQQVLYVGRS